MKRPRRVLICGQPFTVKWEDRPAVRLTEHSEEGLVGAASVSNQCLAVRTLQGDRQLRDTLLHETLHAIVAMTGQGDRFKPNDEHEDWPEEPVVAAVATALLAVLRDNPEVVEWLVHEEAP